jgi:hypothetical protein
MKTLSSRKDVRLSSLRCVAALCTAALGLALAGCQHTVKEDHPEHPMDNPAITAAPTTGESHAFTGTAGDHIGDDYVYYPAYEVYYSPASKEYVYYNGSVWVRSTSPEQTWIKEIRSADSVPVTFRDSPENHHAETLRQYPRDWHPASTPGEPTRTTNDDVRDGKTTK